MPDGAKNNQNVPESPMHDNTCTPLSNITDWYMGRTLSGRSGIKCIILFEATSLPGRILR